MKEKTIHELFSSLLRTFLVPRIKTSMLFLVSFLGYETLPRVTSTFCLELPTLWRLSIYPYIPGLYIFQNKQLRYNLITLLWILKSLLNLILQNRKRSNMRSTNSWVKFFVSAWKRIILVLSVGISSEGVEEEAVATTQGETEAGDAMDHVITPHLLYVCTWLLWF